MKLAQILDSPKGVMLKDGTVVYSIGTEETSILVQGIKDSNKYGDNYVIRNIEYGFR